MFYVIVSTSSNFEYRTTSVLCVVEKSDTYKCLKNGDIFKP